MTSTDLAIIFRAKVQRPVNVEGDSRGMEATTADIFRLLEAEPDSLTADDFSGYLGYCTTGGDDDLLFLFPPILRIWEKALYEKDSWFTQYFHEEVCRTDFVERVLTPSLREAVGSFVVRALSDRIASESSLSVEGSSTSHDWFGYLASLGVFTKEVSRLWSGVWLSKHPGHAVALLQYLSCLIYENANPIFTPWTCDLGGGSPELWGYDSVGFDESWKKENVDYLASALNSKSIKDWLERMSGIHIGSQIAEFCGILLGALNDSGDKVDERIALLLRALQNPSDVGIVTWDSLRESL